MPSFDEYAIQPWEGECNAFDEFLADKEIKLKFFGWTRDSGVFVVTE
jgi:hypothetical protein